MDLGAPRRVAVWAAILTAVAAVASGGTNLYVLQELARQLPVVANP